MAEIIPAILAHSIIDAKKKIAQLELMNVRKAQIDFADGNFVPNVTIMPHDIAKIKTKISFEAHVMVQNPKEYIVHAQKKFNMFIFHIEAEPAPKALIRKVKASGMQCGIAINPKTSLNFIEQYVDVVDMVLFLSVEPGFQGREFIDSVITKIKEFRHIHHEKSIGIDGGIKLETILKLKGLNINEIVVGSGIWQNENPKEMYDKLVIETQQL